MIDLFSLVLAHGLLLVMAVRLVLRDDLDADPSTPQDQEPSA